MTSYGYINILAASLVPVNFEIRVDGPRTLTFSWDHPQGFETSGFITNYQLTCFPRLLGFPKVYVSHEFTEHGVVATESGFSPSTIYNCSVLAANRLGEGPSTSVVATTLEDSMPASSFHSCVVIAASNSFPPSPMQQCCFSCRLLGSLTVACGQ